MRGWAWLSRLRGEPAPELYLPLEGTTEPPASQPQASQPQASQSPASPPPASPPQAFSQPAEEGAREFVLTIMRAAPDRRYRAARALGLLDGPDSGGGPQFERRLLERARDTRRLSALEEALRR